MIVKNPNPLNIAVDYDGTLSTDVIMFIQWIRLAQTRGHNIFVVTARYPYEAADIYRAIGNLCPVYCTSRTLKKPFMERQGIIVDWWIENQPEWIQDPSEFYMEE